VSVGRSVSLLLANMRIVGAFLGDDLDATDVEPSCSGAAHGAGHITLLEEVATARDY